MTTVLDLLETFVQLGPGSAPLPPDPTTLGNFTPNLSGLERDPGGIIMMPQDKCGEIAPDQDGGDSAHREGVAAFCNSEADKKLLPLFEDGKGYMVRHPTQVPWNNTNNSTLDQLRGYMVGCWRAGRYDIAGRLLEAHRARAWFCQNSHAPTRCPVVDTSDKAKTPDVMQPHEIMCLNIASGNFGAYLDPVAQFWLYAAIMVASRDPHEDNNNLMLLSILCGRLNVFVAAHPNWKDFVKWYWRSQAPLGDAVIAVVEKELQRYPEDVLINLLPQQTIELLKSLNLEAELKNLDPGHRAQLALRFADAALRDAAGLFTHAMQLSVQEAVNRLKKLDPQATAEQLTKAFHDAVSGHPEDAIRTALVAAGFPADQVNQSVAKFFPVPLPPTPPLPPLPPIPPIPKAPPAPPIPPIPKLPPAPKWPKF